MAGPDEITQHAPGLLSNPYLIIWVMIAGSVWIIKTVFDFVQNWRGHPAATNGSTGAAMGEALRYLKDLWEWHKPESGRQSWKDMSGVVASLKQNADIMERLDEHITDNTKNMETNTTRFLMHQDALSAAALEQAKAMTEQAKTMTIMHEEISLARESLKATTGAMKGVEQQALHAQETLTNFAVTQEKMQRQLDLHIMELERRMS